MGLNFHNENVPVSYSLPNFKEAIDKISEQFTKFHRELYARARKNIPEAIIEAKETIYIMLPHLLDQDNYSEEKKRKIVDELFYDVIGLGPIHDLYHSREDKTDLFIDGPFDIYYKNKRNQLVDTNIRFRDEEHLQFVLDKLLDPVGEALDKTHLSVECALQDGTRLSALHELVSGAGTSVSFRFHNDKIFSLDDLIRLKTINPQMAWFYQLAADTGLNTIVFGDTGSGKTTFLASYIILHEKLRIAVITDIMEMFIKKKFPKMKALEIHERKRGDSTFTTYDGLIKVLRHQIDRIFFNEVRDGAFYTLLDAWASGHPGGAGTHACSKEEAWDRMMIMTNRGDNNLTDMTCARMIASTVDILIECQEYREGKLHAAVHQLIRNNGVDPVMTTLFEYDFSKDQHVSKIENIDEKLLKKFEKAGIDFFAEAKKSGLFDMK